MAAFQTSALGPGTTSQAGNEEQPAVVPLFSTLRDVPGVLLSAVLSELCTCDLQALRLTCRWARSAINASVTHLQLAFTPIPEGRNDVYRCLGSSTDANTCDTTQEQHAAQPSADAGLSTTCTATQLLLPLPPQRALPARHTSFEHLLKGGWPGPLPQLQRLAVAGDVACMQAFVDAFFSTPSSCPALRSLALAGGHGASKVRVSQRTTARLAAACPLLERLSLTGCTFDPGATIEALAALTALRSLHLGSRSSWAAPAGGHAGPCPALLKASCLSGLTSLTLPSPHATSSQALSQQLRLLTSLRNLQHLDTCMKVDGWKGLEAALECLLQLQQLHTLQLRIETPGVGRGLGGRPAAVPAAPAAVSTQHQQQCTTSGTAEQQQPKGQQPLLHLAHFSLQASSMPIQGAVDTLEACLAALVGAQPPSLEPGSNQPPQAQLQHLCFVACKASASGASLAGVAPWLRRLPSLQLMLPQACTAMVLPLCTYATSLELGLPLTPAALAALLPQLPYLRRLTCALCSNARMGTWGSWGSMGVLVTQLQQGKLSSLDLCMEAAPQAGQVPQPVQGGESHGLFGGYTQALRAVDPLVDALHALHLRMQPGSDPWAARELMQQALLQAVPQHCCKLRRLTLTLPQPAWRALPRGGVAALTGLAWLQALRLLDALPAYEEEVSRSHTRQMAEAVDSATMLVLEPADAGMRQVLELSGVPSNSDPWVSVGDLHARSALQEELVGLLAAACSAGRPFQLEWAAASSRELHALYGRVRTAVGGAAVVPGLVVGGGSLGACLADNS